MRAALLLAACAAAAALPACARESTGREIDSFSEAVAAFEDETGARRLPTSDVDGGVAFAVPFEQANASLRDWTEDYLDDSAYVFRYETNFDIRKDPDIVVLLPTSDKFAVLRAAGTSGPNYDITNADIIRWLREFDREQPFLLTEAGMDYFAGWLNDPPDDSLPLAKRFYRLCPDIVEQGTGTVEALAEEMESGSLFCWWD